MHLLHFGQSHLLRLAVRQCRMAHFASFWRRFSLLAGRSELEAANKQLSQLASEDGLTGLLNRRAFDDTLLVVPQFRFRPRIADVVAACFWRDGIFIRRRSCMQRARLFQAI